MLQLFFAVAFSAVPLTLYIPPIRSLNLFVESLEQILRHLTLFSLRLSPRLRTAFSRLLSSLLRSRHRYGIHNINGSAERNFKAASGAPEEQSVIRLAHNGPTGLGSNMNDICGRDWVHEGGDHGDPDLAHAISQLKEKTTHTFPLVVFGHMHKELAFGSGPRKMIVVGDDNTVYLNGAIVPRVIKLPSEQGTCNRSPIKNETPHVTPESEGTLRAFTVIEYYEWEFREDCRNLGFSYWRQNHIKGGAYIVYYWV